MSVLLIALSYLHIITAAALLPSSDTTTIDATGGSADGSIIAIREFERTQPVHTAANVTHIKKNPKIDFIRSILPFYKLILSPAILSLSILVGKRIEL
jgi:hypothetical protein